MSTLAAPPADQMTVPDTPPAKPVPNFGETGGAMIVLEKALLVRGDTELIRGMDLSVMPGDRVGLVGQNGAGKSTLLGAIAGVRRAEEGKIVVKNGARVGYLVQTAVSGSTRTVWEEAASQMDKINDARAAIEAAKAGAAEARVEVDAATPPLNIINDARAAMEAAEARVEADTEGADTKALEEFLDSMAVYEAVGGYTQDKTVAEVLTGLGFEPEDYEAPCTEFSGGWQMRIALARMLLSDSELLLLDEPRAGMLFSDSEELLLLDEPVNALSTNHLDSAAKTWLGKYVSTYEGTVVVVSHDEAFMEAIRCTTIAEVANCKLEVFKCGYKKYLFERDERVRLALAKFEREQEEMARMQTVIDRFGAKTMGAKMAADRQKKLDKMAAAASDDPTELKRKVMKARMRLPAPPSCHKDQITLKDAAYGWGGDAPTVAGVDLKLLKGQVALALCLPGRLVILGPNGAGKSTTLRAIAGLLPLQSGSRVEGEGLNMGVFTQDLAQDLPQDAVALEHVLHKVREYDTTISDEQARNVLGGLGLTGPKALRPIGWLSGGEKARVALAIFSMIPHNLLLLDEPSNHLDTGAWNALRKTLESLVEAVKGWEGTVVVVSHNREFVESIEATHTAVVKGGGMEYHNRAPAPQDWEWGEEDAAASAAASKRAPSSKKKMGKN
ncbi:ABC transporter [Tribonema minus]|uniref:ABC transporter n=1 Tax=Tribonema minus TaxID=303371 RepID=A0A835Z7Z5_9STRA|nr:ABC transporter [Tribonema minus]